MLQILPKKCVSKPSVPPFCPCPVPESPRSPDLCRLQIAARSRVKSSSSNSPKLRANQPPELLAETKTLRPSRGRAVHGSHPAPRTGSVSPPASPPAGERSRRPRPRFEGRTHGSARYLSGERGHPCVTRSIGFPPFSDTRGPIPPRSPSPIANGATRAAGTASSSSPLQLQHVTRQTSAGNILKSLVCLAKDKKRCKRQAGPVSRGYKIQPGLPPAGHRHPTNHLSKTRHEKRSLETPRTQTRAAADRGSTRDGETFPRGWLKALWDEATAASHPLGVKTSPATPILLLGFFFCFYFVTVDHV